MLSPPSLPIIGVSCAPVLLALSLVGLVVGVVGELLPLPRIFSGSLAFFLVAIALVLDAMVGYKQATAMSTTDLVHDFSPRETIKKILVQISGRKIFGYG
jgi:hypothetical protein